MLIDRYVEVFHSNMIEMQKRSRPPPLMSSRPGPYDRSGYGGRGDYASRNRMRGEITSVSPSPWYILSLLATSSKVPFYTRAAGLDEQVS